MKKLAILAALLICFLFSVSFTTPIANPQKIGYIITKENEEIFVYDRMSQNNAYFHYNNEKGEEKLIHTKNVKIINTVFDILLNCPIDAKKKKFRLMKLMAINSEYALLNFLDLENFELNFIIFDYNGNIVKDDFKKVVFARNKRLSEENNLAIFDIIKTYFGSCKELMLSIQKDLKNNANVELEKEKVWEYISALKCDGAPDLDKFLKDFMDIPYSK